MVVARRGPGLRHRVGGRRRLVLAGLVRRQHQDCRRPYRAPARRGDAPTEASHPAGRTGRGQRWRASPRTASWRAWAWDEPPSCEARPTLGAVLTKVVVDNGGTDWLTPVATLLAVLIGSRTSWLAQSKLANRRALTEDDARSGRAAAAAARLMASAAFRLSAELGRSAAESAALHASERRHRPPFWRRPSLSLSPEAVA